MQDVYVTSTNADTLPDRWKSYANSDLELPIKHEIINPKSQSRKTCVSIYRCSWCRACYLRLHQWKYIQDNWDGSTNADMLCDRRKSRAKSHLELLLWTNDGHIWARWSEEACVLDNIWPQLRNLFLYIRSRHLWKTERFSWHSSIV